MPAAYPSATNVFVRDHAATEGLVVDFARNPTDFPLNQYVQIIPVQKVAGYYLEMTVEEAGRIVNNDLRNFVWPDGNPAPEGHTGTESFNWKEYRCQRYAYPVTLGDLTVDQATWPILDTHRRIKAQQAMTARVQAVMNVALSTGSYPTSHVIDVTTLPGNTGNWAQATTANGNIKRSINTAVARIKQDTFSAVRRQDMVLVVSLELAQAMAESQEIVDYLKSSPYALPALQHQAPQFVEMGLPPVLYGVRVVIEDTYKVTSRKGVTSTVRSPVLPKANALLVSRPGGLEGVANTPNFSTLAIFAQEEMTVENLEDRTNRRILTRVVDTIGAAVLAPASGVLFTACA